MKKLIFITSLLFFFISVKSQNPHYTIQHSIFGKNDTIGKPVVNQMENSIKYVSIGNDLSEIKNDLIQCHKEYQVGTGVFFSGISIVIIGTSVAISGSNSGEYMMGIGGIIALIGSAIQIDSHKWIGKAGIGLGGDGIILKYKLN